MTNEIILRYACAALIVACLLLLLLWRVAKEDVQHYKTLSIDLNEELSKLFHEYHKALQKVDKLTGWHQNKDAKS